MDKYLDFIVPRGGKGLIETVVSHARMPVIKHYDGICHVYVDNDADLAMAESIVINAKMPAPRRLQRHRDRARASRRRGEFLRDDRRRLREKGVEMRGDARPSRQQSQPRRSAARRRTEEPI